MLTAVREREGLDMSQSCAELPTWVQYLQASLTPTIAVLAVVIGWFQWRTAHQRAVLDLFDKRMEVHDAVSTVISSVVATGSAGGTAGMDFIRAASRVEILFGPEVKQYLDTVYKALTNHHLAEIESQRGSEEHKSAALDRKYAAFDQITAFFTKFPKLVRPYVRMHQKAPWF
jgi:hypothetical protein